MRYHYKKPALYSYMYGKTYENTDNPIYTKGTLYEIGNKGIVVIQQRYIQSTKCTYWDEVEPDLVDKLYLHPKFKAFFEDRARTAEDGYPTVTIRQLMWALRMKPLPKEVWETCFDRREV